MLAWLVLAYAALSASGRILPTTGTALSLLTTGLVLSGLGSRRSLRSLATLWPCWVSSEAHEVEATVLVCDLAGYTSHSEQTAPRAMPELLRGFFHPVEEAVGESGGVLACRPGDAAIVLFRQEACCPRHPRRPCMGGGTAVRI